MSKASAKPSASVGAAVVDWLRSDDIDLAVEMRVADHERPVAIAPIGQAEARGHHRQRDIAEEQFEPLPGGRVEPEFELAERGRRRPPGGNIWRTNGASAAGWRGRSRTTIRPTMPTGQARRQRSDPLALPSNDSRDAAPTISSAIGTSRSPPSAASAPRRRASSGIAASRSSSRSSGCATVASPSTAR